MSNQKGAGPIGVLAVGVIALLIVGLVFVLTKTNINNPLPRNSSTNQTSQQAANNANSQPQGNNQNQVNVPAVNSPQDLTTVSKDLDNTDLNSIDTSLSQNNADAATF